MHPRLRGRVTAWRKKLNMSHISEIHDDLCCVFVKWRDVWSVKNQQNFYNKLEAREGFRPGLNRLHDLREVNFNVQATELRKIAGVVNCRAWHRLSLHV